jgi:prepilin-type N-terminal cleavage/methylation domain-containing protein
MPAVGRAHGAGFTLIELLVVASIIALVMGLLVPCLGAARQRAKMAKNAANVRGITASLLIWADANMNGRQFPAACPNHKLAASLPLNATDTSTAGRFWALLAGLGEPPPPQALVNPAGKETPYMGSYVPGASQSPQFGPNNLSYAMLDPSAPEYTSNGNSAAPLIADMNTFPGPPGPPEPDADVSSPGWSYWSRALGWQGHVGWGDGHVSFEFSSKFTVVALNQTCADNDIWVATGNTAPVINLHLNNPADGPIDP